MLIQIHIRNLATIEDLQLNLNSCSTMITGETGAGKSIFLEAIELALGGRASANIIRPGKDKAEISLCFEISKFPHVISCLQTLDLYQDAPECIIRRVITSDGRSRSYVNGSPSTLQLVKELGELLFHLHGQYEQQVLLKPEYQREILDRFADHLPLVAEVKQLAEEGKSLTAQINMLREKTLERTERSEFLRFQLDELSAQNLQAGEWEKLEAEHHKLAHAEELLRHIQAAKLLISDDESKNVLSILHGVRKTLESIQQVESKSNEWINTLNSALILLGDLDSELHQYLENTNLDPDQLQKVEEKISVLFNLARKHKIQPKELFSFKEKIETELNTLNSSDEDLVKLQNLQQEIQQKYFTKAENLSASRKKAAAKLEKTITTTIRALSLPHGEFAIVLEKEIALLSGHGNEKIIFQIKTNPDQTLQAIAKVISGGELSRLSLATHLALADKTNIPTLIFDEVDTGLSGATAEKIGKLLRKLGDSYQVFCVTHQPQVAACGHFHLLVEKYFIEKTTHTRLRHLDAKERTKEVARMLGGEKITQKTLDHAEEILSQT